MTFIQKVKHMCTLYTVSGKRRHSTFARNFAKCRPILKILSPTDLAVICVKVVTKYPTILQTCRYTTLWNCCVQKSQWPGAVWRELPCKTQPFTTSAEKYLRSNVSIISVHWRKDIYSGRNQNQRLRYVVHDRGAIRIAHYDVIDDVITRKL